MRAWRIRVVVAWLVMAGTPALAQPPAQPTVPQRAEPLVVTATKDEIPLEQIGASVTIVTEETFAAQQYRTVDEVLRSVPGVDVQTSGSPGKFTSVRIRGANAAQIQVLIDGVRVKSTTSGDFDFADLTLDDVQRIEVVRGPQSTVYGADAIGGVINIITKRGQGKPTAWFDFEAGNYETFRERAGVSGEVGAWNFSLGASRLDFGGQFDNDEHDVTSFNGRVGYALPNNGEVALIARYSDAHRGIPFETVFPNFSPRREQDDTLLLGSLVWTQPWVEWYEHALRLSAIRSSLTFRDPDSLFETRSDVATDRREVDWVHLFHFGKLDTLTVGLEYRNEQGEIKGTFSETTDTFSVFVQDELRLFDALFLTGGVRYDHNSAFGDATTGRAALSYVIRATDTRLKASWAEGFRAPTFNELFFPATFPPCPAFGNPNLKPEESESYDAGVEQYLWQRRIRLAATVFHNDFDNLIQTALIDPVNFCFQAQNVGKARTQGVEAEARVSPIDTLLLALVYTYTDTEDRTTGDPLRRFPPNRWAITATWEALPGLTLAAEILILSSQFEASGVPRNEGYTVVNAAASYRLPWKWGPLSEVLLHLKITNLFNEDYAEVRGFPALGTHVVAGVRATF